MASNIDVLLNIQTELKAPKGQYNSFGKYKYRSCEDILEAVKPLLIKYGASLILTDSIENVGDRYYVKATAMMISKDGEVINTVSAFAREPEKKTGMDESQITGTASSYARKYALNGLFLIDDTKDEDTDELREEKQARAEQQKAITSQPQRRTSNKDKVQKDAPADPEKDVKPEEEMTKPTDIITPAHVKAVRARIAKAAEKGKRLEEADLCKMLKIESFEQMNYGQLNWFNNMMEKNGV